MQAIGHYDEQRLVIRYSVIHYSVQPDHYLPSVSYPPFTMSSYLSAIFPRARALISKPCLNASRPFTSIYLSRRIPSTPLNAYLPTKSTLPPSPSSNLRPSKPPTTLPTTQTRHATSNYTPKPTSTGSTKKSLRQRPDPRISKSCHNYSRSHIPPTPAYLTPYPQHNYDTTSSTPSA